MELGEILILIGGAAIFLWGIGHIVPTRAVVAGFGSISTENRRILVMEWLIEGLTLCFAGVLAIVTTLVLGADARGTTLVSCLLAGFLLLLAGVSLATGARTSIIPMKLCPYVKTVVAVLLVTGALL
jgi:hypothetical protein